MTMKTRRWLLLGVSSTLKRDRGPINQLRLLQNLQSSLHYCQLLRRQLLPHLQHQHSPQSGLTSMDKPLQELHLPWTARWISLRRMYTSHLQQREIRVATIRITSALTTIKREKDQSRKKSILLAVWRTISWISGTSDTINPYSSVCLQ